MTWLVTSYGLAIAVQIGFPILLAIWVRRTYRTRWRYFGFGAAVFFVSQMITRIPLIQLVQYLIAEAIKRSKGLLVAWIGIAAFTAGLFEEVGRYLGYRLFWRAKEKTWESAVMYGVGHGGLESMLLIAGLSVLGLINTVALSTMDLSTLNLGAEKLKQIEEARALVKSMPAWAPLMGGLERVLTLPIQISFSVIVLQCFRGAGLRALWLAIGYHGLVNFVGAAVAHFSEASTRFGWRTVAVEALVAAFAVISLVIIRRLRKPAEGQRGPDEACGPQQRGLD